MAKISQDELKKAILAAEAKRSKHPVVLRLDPTQYPTLLNSRRSAEKLVSEFLREAGLDTKKLEEVQKRQSAELQRIIDKHKADALKLASRQKDTLQSTILKQSMALRHLVAQGDGFFPDNTFFLDTPVYIWPIPIPESTETLSFDYAVAPADSWAKFRFRSSEHQGTQRMGFYFDWTNPYSDYAVINAITFISATGYVTTDAPWTPLFGGSMSQVTVEARFAIWFDLPRQAASTPYTSAQLGLTGALGSWLTGSDTEGISISAGVNLYQTMFAIPPGQFVVFEVALAVSDENEGDGHIDADFESGDFKITCPVVVFWLVNSPPTSAVAGLAGRGRKRSGKPL